VQKNLYILKSKEEVDYDEYEGFVVRADNAKEARQLAETQSRGSYPHQSLMGRFTDPKRSSCNYISRVGKSKILLSDFKAG